jgi:hypothetical protein
MAVLGQEYTNAAKDTSGNEEDLVPISQLSFLKRGFVEFSNLIVFAPIEIESIEKEFTFCKYDASAAEILGDVLENAVLEAAMISQEYFNIFVNAIYPKWREYRLKRGGITTRWSYRDSIKALCSKLTK